MRAGTSRVLGNPLPEWEGSANGTLTLWRNLQLFALVDFLGGNKILSGDIRASLMSFRNQRSILEAKDPILLAYDILDTRRQPGIVKGGFAKLRQVSATYTFPQSWLRPRGFAARRPRCRRRTWPRCGSRSAPTSA